MAVGSVISGSISDFGSLASIRRQAKEIGDRVKRESDARKEEQERTGLIKNQDGDMVEISSLTQKEVDWLNDWHDAMLVSPKEAMIGFMATAPHSDEVEESKRLGAKYEKLQNKMLQGQKLTGEEKSFLREHYPQLASMADRMEAEAEGLKKKLQGCKSKEAANKAYLEAKINVMNGLDTKDGSALFLMAAIDKAYEEHTGKRTRPKTEINTLA